MASLTNLPDAIQWSEGMLLSPQHFQQNDDYWHQQLRHRLNAVTPHYWGVLQLNCQLISETITISKLECILPDGLLVEFPGRYPREPKGDLEIKVGDECKVGGSPQKVWLLVNPRGANAALQESKERRYNSVIDNSVVDENTAESGFAIARLQVEFQLVLGTKSPSTEYAVPLCEVIRGDNKQLAITNYHPPMLRVDASGFQGESSLLKKLNALHERLWNGAQQLAAQSNQPDHESEIYSAPRQYVTVAHALGRCLPPLSILLSSNTHPTQLYNAIANVVGEISAIGSNPLPLLMRPYQHDDCQPQFKAAMEYIDAQLQQVNTGHESLAFRRVDQYDTSGNFACFERFLSAPVGTRMIIELIPKVGQDKDKLAHWLSEAKIASDDVMPQLRRTRIFGAKKHVLSKTDIYKYKLHPQAALFVIENKALIFDDKPPVNAFGEEKMLLIMGKNNEHAPANIILHSVNSAVLPFASLRLGVTHE